jgi:hypothetical protein
MDRMPLCFYGCTMAASERLTSVVLSSSRCCSIEAFNAFQPLSRRPRSVRFLPAFPSPAESSWRQSGRSAVHRHGDVRGSAVPAACLCAIGMEDTVPRYSTCTAQYGTIRNGTDYLLFLFCGLGFRAGWFRGSGLPFLLPLSGGQRRCRGPAPKADIHQSIAIPAGVFLLALASSAGSPPRPARRGRRKWEKGEPRPSAARPSNNRGGVYTVIKRLSPQCPSPRCRTGQSLARASLAIRPAEA